MHPNIPGGTSLSTHHHEPNYQPHINVRLGQAAKEIGISMSWLYVLIDRGILPKPHKIYPGSKAVALYRHELDAFIAGRYASGEVK